MKMHETLEGKVLRFAIVVSQIAASFGLGSGVLTPAAQQLAQDTPFEPLLSLFPQTQYALGATQASTLTVQIFDITTGTAFTADPADPACTSDSYVYTPGYDCGGNNSVVLTGDTIQYSVLYRNQYPFDATADNVILFKMPAEGSWAALPSACFSSPGVPRPGSAIITETTYADTIVCNLGKPTGTTDFSGGFTIIGRARPSALNGSVLTATAKYTDTVTPIGATAFVTDVVSGSPKFDLKKSQYGVYAMYFNGVFGYRIAQHISIIATGGLGSERLDANPITFTDILTGLSSNISMVTPFSDNGPSYGCNIVTVDGTKSMPYGKIGVVGGANATTSVVDSGTINCSLDTSTSPPRINFTITGLNSAPDTYPTKDNSNTDNVASGYVGSYQFAFFVPGTDVATAPDGILPAMDTYINFDPNSASGISNYGSSNEPMDNNTLSYNIQGFSGTFAKMLCKDGTTPTCSIPDSIPYSTNNSGDALSVVSAGQYMRTLMRYENTSSQAVSDVILCETFDNTKQILADFAATPNKAVRTTYTAGNGVAAISGTLPALAQQLIVQYGTGPAGPGTPGSTCGDADSPTGWSNTTSGVPGGIAATTKVRVVIPVISPGMRIYASVRSQILPNASGTHVPDWVSLASPIYTHTSAFVPPTGLGFAAGTGSNYGVSNGLFVILVQGVTSIQKNTIPPNIALTSAGQQVTYVLTPTYTSDNPSAPPTTVIISDVLPAGLSYVGNSASIDPDAVLNNTPSSGLTTILWSIPNVTPSSTITPITYKVTVNLGVPANSTLVNTATIGYVGEDSPISARQAAYSIRTDSVFQTSVQKRVFPSIIEPGDAFSTTLQYINTGLSIPQAVSIDVLPYIGDARTPATNYNGVLTLTSVSVPGGVSYLCSTTPPTGSLNDSDPNLTTLIFDTCPSGFAGVTALIFTDTLGITSTLRTFATLNFATSGNKSGDLYANNFATQPQGGLFLRSDTVVEPVQMGQLSGVVYHDVNVSGSNDSGDIGLPGVVITLTGIDKHGSAVLTTTTTDANGNYTFTELVSGIYTVTEKQPSDYLDFKETIGTAGGNISINDVIRTISLSPGQISYFYNFGEILPAALGARVYLDAGMNMTDDLHTDAGIPGTVITLTGTDAYGALVTLTLTTDASGWVTFTNLVPGTYKLIEQQPAGYFDYLDSAGTVGGSASNDLISPINLLSNVTATNYLFGEVIPSTFSGAVYEDTNSSLNLNSGDKPIPGTVITLTGVTITGYNYISTTVTDANGLYTFTGLYSGTYTVTEQQPAAYDSMTDTVGSVGGTLGAPSPNVISAVQLWQGVNATGYNFGEFIPATLGGHVYDDVPTRNGVYDGSDLPIPGTTITLTGITITGLAYISTTVTDANGLYTFTGLAPGIYTLTEKQPSGYADSADTLGSGAATPGTAGNDTFTGIVLQSGNAAVNYNFGELMASDTWISKSASPTQTTPGGTVVYTVLIGNNGPSTATVAYMTDTLPAGLTVLTVAEIPPLPGDLCSFSAGQAGCTVFNLATGTTRTIVINAQIATNAMSGTITNMAMITSAQDITTTNNTATATIQIISPLAAVEGTVFIDENGTAAANPHPDGTDVLYAVGATITLTDANGVTHTTTTDTYGHYSFSGLPAGPYTVTVGATPGYANVTPLTLMGTAPAGGTALNNDFGLYKPPMSDLSVSKSGPVSASVGGQVAYQIVITNNGPDEAALALVYDPTPTGLTFASASDPCGGGFPCDISPMASGSVKTIMVVYAVNSGFAAPGNITNTVMVTSPTDITTTNNTATVTTPITPLPVPPAVVSDLGLSKTGTASVVAGGLVTYQLTVINNGPDAAQVAVLDDPAPAGLVFVGATYPCSGGFPCSVLPLPVLKGEVRTVEVVYQVPTNYAGTLITNTATITSPTDLVTTTNNVATATTTVLPPPPGTVAGTVFVDNNGTASANPHIDGTDSPYVAGAIITLTDSTGGVLTTTTDTNGNYEFTNVPAGAFTVTVGATPGYANATATTLTGSVPAGGSSTMNDFGLNPPPAASDLTIAKSGPASVTAGANVQYQIVITNNGPNAASLVVIQDPTPAGLTFVNASAPCAGGFPCTLDNMPMLAGSARSIQVVYSVPENYAVTTITNTATVTSPTDITTTNNTSSVTTTVVLPPPTTGSITGTVFFDANNNGILDPGEGLPNISVTVTDANGNTQVVTTDANGVYTATNLATGGALVDVVNSTLPPNITQSVGIDPSGVNVVAGTTQNAGVDGYRALVSDLSVYKIGPSTVNAGTTVQFQIIVLNSGPDAATLAILKDPTPSGLIFLSSTAPCAGGFPCDVAPLGNGSVKSILVTYAVPINYTSTMIVNTASITSPTDSVTSNNTATSTVTVQTMVQTVGATVRGIVFIDTNGTSFANPHPDGTDQPYTPGVVVTLTDSTSKVYTTTTDSFGHYNFDNVTPGDYTVVMGPVSPFYTVVTPISISGHVADGAISTGNDFGLAALTPVLIGDHIWQDNGSPDGIYQTTDTPLAGVVVTATRSDGLVFTATTDANGQYTLTVPPTSTYNIGYGLPTGLLPSTAGTTDTSAGSNNTNHIDGVSVAVGATNNTNIDFALRKVPTAINLAYFDAQLVCEGVSLSWQTLSEQNTAGFVIYRAESDSFADAEAVADSMTYANGAGAAYQFIDAAKAGKTYHYWLVEVTTSGEEKAIASTSLLAQGCVR